MQNIEDFNWHDCSIYSIKFDDNLELDLDYIVEWKLMSGSEYQYLIAPATLVFFDVRNFKIHVKADFLNGFEIIKITKGDGNNWTIDLQEGEIEFESSGFNQVLRKTPVWVKKLSLNEHERI